MLTIGIGVLFVIAARPCVVAQFFACDVPKNIILRTPSNESNAIITQAKMEVYLDVNSISFSQNRYVSTTDYRKFRADHVKVVLRGYLERPVENGNGSCEVQRQVGTALEKIIKHYNGSMSGAVAYNRTTLNSTGLQSAKLSVSDDCHVTLLLTSKARLGEEGATLGLRAMHSDGIPSEVRRLAESCVQREICPKIPFPELTNENQTPLRRSKRAATLKLWVLQKILGMLYHNRTRRSLPLPKIDLGEKTDVTVNGAVYKRVQLCTGKVVLATSLLSLLSEKEGYKRFKQKFTFHVEFKIIELTLKFRRTKYLFNGEKYTGQFIDTIKDAKMDLKFSLDWSAKPVKVAISSLTIDPGTTVISASAYDKLSNPLPTITAVAEKIKKDTAATMKQLKTDAEDKDHQATVACKMTKYIENLRFLFV